MAAGDKSKLDGIAAGAQVNPGNATPQAAGLMAADDKSKLDGIAAGAQVNPGVVNKLANGLAPQLPDEEAVLKFLRQDGTWQIPVGRHILAVDESSAQAESESDPDALVFFPG
jgi:hypothetical protein